MLKTKIIKAIEEAGFDIINLEEDEDIKNRLHITMDRIPGKVERVVNRLTNKD